mmetsp:Transcript_816/g.1466  ORF Transcript_816/g.1466 Transcript_816/m.1466 type:complete len:104 (+) Transcript_816:433-744(+)
MKTSNRNQIGSKGNFSPSIEDDSENERDSIQSSTKKRTTSPLKQSIFKLNPKNLEQGRNLPLFGTIRENLQERLEIQQHEESMQLLRHDFERDTLASQSYLRM